MKKFFIAIAALALVASAACTKVNPEEKKAEKISFSVANYVPQTKADEPKPVSVLGDFTSFKCRAFLHAKGVEVTNAGLSTSAFQNFFPEAGETISPNNTTAPTEWAPSHAYYWPKDASSFVNFVGWYGTDGTNAVDPTISYAYDATEAKWTAKMNWTFSTTLGQAGSNLLYADMAWRYKENDDTPMYGVSTNVAEGVPMLFHHALAQINVKAYAESKGETGMTALTAGEGTVTDGVATWTIKFDNAKITPIYANGELELTNADPGTNKTQAWTGEWVGTDTTAGDVEVADYTVDDVTKATAGDVIAPSCVLPQSLTDVVLSFDLDITTTYTGNLKHHEIIPVSIKFSDMGTSAWEQNHKYTYYIKVVPSQNKVLFDPALDAAWIEVEGGEATL